MKGKFKVLIVDDDTDLLDMLSEIMVSAGFEVVTASDGIDGSSKYSHEPFDLILTDIKMPKEDGIKFVQFIQDSELSTKPTPIILISASADEYRSRMEVPGSIELLNKPFSMKVFLEVVNRLLPINI